MNISDLARELERCGVPSSAYCLDGGLPNERYTIERRGDVWTIYYSERGCRTELREFTIESEACTEFLEWIRREVSA